MGIEEDFKKQMILKAMSDGRIVGSVRAYAKEGVCNIGRLVVEPTYQNKGLGARFPAATRFELFTVERSKKSLYLYHKAGYEIFPSIFLCYFEIKSNSRSATFSAWSEILPSRSMS
ncbi:MAG: GNAT family N-acetyltransferase [Desulfofustis sp.]|nr:GNAT family N-acetyltransferase [Desulfofustis sp.]